MSAEQSKKGKWTIPALVLLIVALVVGVKVIFAGLANLAPEQERPMREPLMNSQGENSGYTLLQQAPEGGDVEQWLAAAQSGGREAAYWLSRQEAGQYILYLPIQDRAVAAKDMTATEERDGDGEYSLVLRIRTPEGSHEADPDQQLFCLETGSERWKGVRVRVILDGRELEINRQLSIDGALYAAQESGGS